jgi:hypothetical protein
MGVREETLDLLHQGHSPREIANIKGVNIKTTLAYLNELVGKGMLRRSDIFFSIKKEIRSPIISLTSNGHPKDAWKIQRSLKNQGIDLYLDDIDIVIKYGDSRCTLGDMYEDICSIETYLHKIIRKELQSAYGEGELGWWRQGIPVETRKNCQARREEDEQPFAEPYCYTELLDLLIIFDKQWNLLNKILSSNAAIDKHIFKSNINRLNIIRRKVMHPVRGIAPSEDDFEFIREFKATVINSD